MYRHIPIVLFLFLFFPVAAQCQAYDLQACLRYAREHSDLNKISELSLRSAKLSRQTAEAAFLPYISASTGGSLSFGRSIDPETNTYNTNKYLSNSYGASLSLPVFDGLVRVNNLRMMKAIEKKEKEDKAIQENKVSLTVINAYYNCLYYSQTVKQTKQQLQSDKGRLRLTCREEELGIKSGTDVAQMEANVASDEFSLVQQQNLYESALTDLKSYMSFPMDSLLLIDDSLPEELSLELQSEQARELFARAGSYLPEIRSAQLQLKSSKYRVYMANGNFMPSVSFSAGISTSYYVNLDNRDVYASFRDQFKNNVGEYMSVSLSIPVFTRFNNLISKKQAKLNYRMQQHNYAQTLNQIEKNVAQAVADMEGSVKEYLAAKQKLSAVLLAHRANERKFQLGTLSALEYYASQTQLSEARAQFTGKKIQYLIKKMQLDYYKGIPFIQG